MNLTELHAQSNHHKEAVLAVEECSCFYCLRVFPSKGYAGIMEWEDNGQTALCPKCGIDAVLPGYYARATLRVMQRVSFNESNP